MSAGSGRCLQLTGRLGQLGLPGWLTDMFVCLLNAHPCACAPLLPFAITCHAGQNQGKEVDMSALFGGCRLHSSLWLQASSLLFQPRFAEVRITIQLTKGALGSAVPP
jgi:hypothetical protein